MKNGLLIWNVILSLLVGILLVLHFTGNKKNGSASIKPSTDTSSVNRPFRMAYFEMDSVAANFDLVKELKTELSSKEDGITAEMNNRNKALQQKYYYYQEQAQAGKLSQEQQDNASKELKSMDEEMKARKQQLDQEYNNYMMTKQNEIKSKIEAFIKEYNKTKNYSYVVSDDPGLFYYQDTTFNITADVIKGLNDMYKPKKKYVLKNIR